MDTTLLSPRPAGAAVAAPPEQGLHTLAFTTFTCDVVLATVERRTSLTAARGLLEDWGRRFSRFRQDSELTSFNLTAGRWTTISGELHELLTRALTAAIDSRGLFNVTVPYMEQAAPSACPPLTSVLELGRGRARLRPGHTIDFGGLAKGLWADRLASFLGPNAACSIGGDVTCRGDGPSGDGWPVSLPNGRVLVLRNSAVATSGIGRRRRGTHHHIVDPRTGFAADAGVQTASIVTAECATAEWVATSVVVGGTDALRTIRCPAPLTHVVETGDTSE